MFAEDSECTYRVVIRRAGRAADEYDVLAVDHMHPGALMLKMPDTSWKFIPWASISSAQLEVRYRDAPQANQS